MRGPYLYPHIWVDSGHKFQPHNILSSHTSSHWMLSHAGELCFTILKHASFLSFGSRSTLLYYLFLLHLKPISNLNSLGMTTGFVWYKGKVKWNWSVFAHDNQLYSSHKDMVQGYVFFSKCLISGIFSSGFLFIFVWIGKLKISDIFPSLFTDCYLLGVSPFSARAVLVAWITA